MLINIEEKDTRHEICG